MMVGNDILGSTDSRMMNIIRGEHGLAYSAYASLGFPVTTPGDFRAYYQSKSSTCAFAAELFFDLLDAMRTEAVTDDELSRSKASFIDTFPRSFASAGQIVGRFAQDELIGRPHSYWYDYRTNIEAVDAQAITAAMNENLDPDKMIVLMVGNVEEIMKGHPDHEAKLTDFGPIHQVPLRDPLTLEPIVE
jgi:zinc protease